MCSTKTGSFIPELSGWSFPGCRVEITYCTVVLNACFNFTNFSNWLSFCRGVKLTALRLITEKKREEKKNMSRLKSKRKSIHALWSLCPRLPMKLITAGKRRAKKTLCFCVDFWDYCISFPQASVPISSTSHKLQIIIYTFPATKKKNPKEIMRQRGASVSVLIVQMLGLGLGKYSGSVGSLNICFPSHDWSLEKAEKAPRCVASLCRGLQLFKFRPPRSLRHAGTPLKI